MQFLRFLSAELIEISIRRIRYVGYLAIGLVALILAGSIVVRSLEVRAVVFGEGMSDDEVTRLTEIIEQLGDVRVITVASRLDAELIRYHDAAIGVARDGRRYRVATNAQAGTGSDSLGLSFATALSLALRLPADGVGQRVLFLSGESWSPERIDALPASPRHSFVPRVIALLAVFAPFLVALESYSRQAGSRFLQLQVAARGGSFLSYVFAKVIVSAAVGWCALVALLLGANFFFGLAPKPGLVFILCVFMLAALVSGCFGAVIAMATRPTQQIVGSIAAYFFILIVFSGFFLPLSGAADFVQWGSHLVPLRYPLPLFERWLEEGQSPDVGRIVATWLGGEGESDAPTASDAIELGKFLALAAFAVVAVALTARFVRNRL